MYVAGLLGVRSWLRKCFELGKALRADKCQVSKSVIRSFLSLSWSQSASSTGNRIQKDGLEPASPSPGTKPPSSPHPPWGGQSPSTRGGSLLPGFPQISSVHRSPHPNVTSGSQTCSLDCSHLQVELGAMGVCDRRHPAPSALESRKSSPYNHLAVHLSKFDVNLRP